MYPNVNSASINVMELFTLGEFGTIKKIEKVLAFWESSAIIIFVADAKNYCGLV